MPWESLIGFLLFFSRLAAGKCQITVRYYDVSLFYSSVVSYCTSFLTPISGKSLRVSFSDSQAFIEVFFRSTVQHCCILIKDVSVLNHRHPETKETWIETCYYFPDIISQYLIGKTFPDSDPHKDHFTSAQFRQILINQTLDNCSCACTRVSAMTGGVFENNLVVNLAQSTRFVSSIPGLWVILFINYKLLRVTLKL